MEMPDTIYALDGKSDSYDGVWDNYQWSDQCGTEYHHSRIVEELRRRIAELEAIIEARGM